MDTDDDYSTDEQQGKRKAQKEIEGSFDRSKKTSRTPPKIQQKEDEKWEKILAMMTEMKAGQSEIKKEIQLIGEEQKRFNNELMSIKLENENLKSQNAEIKKENSEIKKELQDIRRTLETIEQKEKRNNVVMSGMTIHTNEPTVLKETINNLLKEHLKVDIHPKTVRKIGEKMCVIELENEKDKKAVMQNKSKFKHSKTVKIYINDDLTKKEREKQRHIRLRAQDEEANGKVVRVGYNKVTIDGIEWRWNKSTDKLEITNPKN